MKFENICDLPLSFIVNNEKITLKDRRVSLSSVSEEENLTIADFILQDFNLKITAIYEENSDFDACEWYFWFENIGQADTPVIKKLLPCDMTFKIDGDITLKYAKGGYCTPEDFRPYQTTLKEWHNFQLWAEGGRSSALFLPFFNMSFDGKGYMGSIGWTGDWECNWYRNELPQKNLNLTMGMTEEQNYTQEPVSKDQFCFTMGMRETCFYLYPGEKVRTPKMSFVEYTGNMRAGQNKLRKYIAKYHNHILNVTGEDKMPIFCSHWGDTQCSTHVKNVELMASHNVDYDYYWIDAAWFGKDPAWMPCTGDWDYIKPKYPEKFKPLTDALHKYGKKFLLWFEPERVCKGTSFERLGEYLIDMPSDKKSLRPDYLEILDPRLPYLENMRNSFGYDEKLIDFSNPDAVDWFIDYFSKFIKENEIDFYRNDANIAVDAFLKAKDRENRVGITEMKWFEGLYRFWDGLLEACPGLLIDNCASGGRRMDIELMDRSVPLWRTDYAHITNIRQNHSLGINEWFINHCSSAGSLAKRATDDVEYNVVSGMTAGMIYTIYSTGDGEQDDPEGVEADFDLINQCVAKYRQIQPYFKYDYYPLTEYSVNDSAVVAYAFYDDASDKGMIVVVNRENSYTKSVEFDLDFVKDKEYKLDFVFGKFDMKLVGKKLSVNFDEKKKATVVVF